MILLARRWISRVKGWFGWWDPANSTGSLYHISLCSSRPACRRQGW